MNASVSQVMRCGRFKDLSGLDPNAIHRFVLGADPAPRTMTAEEAATELGDPFATLLLQQGRFPRTAVDALAALREAVPAGDVLDTAEKTFLLGEGSQLVPPADTAPEKSFRFLLTLGSGPDGPDLLISASDPDQGLIEVMAWDRSAGGFNYYRTVSGDRAWAWAGNSRHAVEVATEGHGPFESHPSGSPLMKELKRPWLHWHSFEANINADDFPPGDARASHPWFASDTLNGAETLESEVMRCIGRWTSARFARAVDAAGKIDRPRRIMDQILGTPTVNLVTSLTESDEAKLGVDVVLPPTFFADSDAFALEEISLDQPPTLTVPADRYLESLDSFEFRLSDGEGFVQQGDTHFAFLVPERSFEDLKALEKALEIGMVTPRLAVCLLMVDFPNPVFSARRASLLDHVPAEATVDGFAQAFADNILAAAESAVPGSPELEFADRWGAGENGWRERANRDLGAYYEALTSQLSTQAGFDGFVKVAESRRDVMRGMPIFESRLLLPTTNIASGSRFALTPTAEAVAITNEEE